MCRIDMKYSLRVTNVLLKRDKQAIREADARKFGLLEMPLCPTL